MVLAVIYYPGLETFYCVEDNKFKLTPPYQIGKMLLLVYPRVAYLDQYCL